MYLAAQRHARDSESQGPTVTAVAIAFAVISAIVILFRHFAWFYVAKSVGLDDSSVQHGLGSHIVDVLPLGPDNMTAYGKIVWLSSIFYNGCLGFIKISVLALYVRLGDPKLRRLSFVMIGVICCQAGGTVCACIFQCSLVRAAYDQSIPPEQAKCININAFYLANAAVNISTDILTYTLPFPLVRKLQIPRRQKTSLAVIFGLGLFACISSIVRITYIPPMLTSDDPTWIISGAMYWSVIETKIGILAASIPSYKSIAKRCAPRLLGSSYGSSGGKLSGFKMGRMEGSGGLGGKNGNRPGVNDSHVEEDGVGDGVCKMSSRKSFGAQVTKCLPDDNSSEEGLVAPSGRIGVRTDIVHCYEEAGLGEGSLPTQGVRSPWNEH
ncbi:hypothetical protein DL765_008733 [Monosporascus sp. GIB2]|nr:hypothetical protein DL765_008733 [Monosporascus sp. GIB2]